MSEEKRRNVSGSFVVCDVQEEYIEYLFAVLSEQLSEVYQFQLFHDPDRVMEFVRREETEALLIAEECRVNTENLPAVNLYKKFGFKILGTRKKYYNNKFDAYIMTKFF